MMNLLALALMPLILHRKDTCQMYHFCLRMAYSASCRKCYRLLLLMMLFIMHFYHLSIFRSHHEVMMTTLLCLVLLSTNQTKRLFSFFQHKKNICRSSFRLLYYGIYTSLHNDCHNHFHSLVWSCLLPIWNHVQIEEKTRFPEYDHT